MVALLLAGMVLLGWQLGTTAFRRDRAQTGAPDTPTPTAGQPPAAVGGEAGGDGAGDFDPDGDGSEHPDEVALAHDGKPATAWSTATYSTSPKLGNLKPGVGMWVDLGAVKPVASVKLQLVGSGLRPQPVRAGTTGRDRGTGQPVRLAEGRGAGRGRRRSGRDTSQRTQARFVLVWFTKLPPDGDGSYRGGVSEIEVRG